VQAKLSSDAFLYDFRHDSWLKASHVSKWLCPYSQRNSTAALELFDPAGRQRRRMDYARLYAQAPHWCPVRYVVFNLLYHAGRCYLREPFVRRREVLAELCQRLKAADVQFSAGVIGAGTMWAARPLHEVKGEIDRWVHLYPGIQGLSRTASAGTDPAGAAASGCKRTANVKARTTGFRRRPFLLAGLAGGGATPRPRCVKRTRACCRPSSRRKRSLSRLSAVASRAGSACRPLGLGVHTATKPFKPLASIW
jgi:hypothetical protein